MPYAPTPIQTETVDLPGPLVQLVDQLAEHVHDTWAQRRMAEGWTYGPERDDVAKTHPGLVPYEDLSETEKDYDRQTALGTLKAAVALGCEIVPPADPAGHP